MLAGEFSGAISGETDVFDLFAGVFVFTNCFVSSNGQKEKKNSGLGAKTDPHYLMSEL